jgi:hypothetical protein
MTEPLAHDAGDHTFLAGIDLAVKQDRAALVVIGCSLDDGKVRLAYCRSWQAMEGEEIDLQSVESHILETHRHFHCLRIFYDIHQAALMSQRLRQFGCPMVEQVFAGRALDNMANCLVATFAARQIELYPEPELIADLKSLQIEDRPWGLKLTAPRDRSGHADLGIALAMILPHANKRALQQWSPVKSDPKPSEPYQRFSSRVAEIVRHEGPKVGFRAVPYSARDLVRLERRSR